MPTFLSDPGIEEIDLAHGSANELCELALWYVAGKGKDVAYWRDVFSQTVGTLSMFPSENSIRALQGFDHPTSLLEDSEIRFAWLRAVLPYPEWTAVAMKEMLQMDVPQAHLSSRDFLLEGVLEQSPGLVVSSDDWHVLAEITLRPTIKFSSQKQARSIKHLIKLGQKDAG